jgi:gliding motility-associated lipoprotein GldH
MAYFFRKKIFFFLLLAGSGISCQGDFLLHDNYDFESEKWPIKLLPTFEVDITDDNQAQYLNKPLEFFLEVRHSQRYAFHNLYVNVLVFDPQQKKIVDQLCEVILFDPVTGAPRGSGSGLYENRYQLPALRTLRFTKKGKYVFKLRQQMREDPLESLSSVGLAIKPADVQ